MVQDHRGGCFIVVEMIAAALSKSQALPRHVHCTGIDLGAPLLAVADVSDESHMTADCPPEDKSVGVAELPLAIVQRIGNGKQPRSPENRIPIEHQRAVLNREKVAAIAIEQIRHPRIDPAMAHQSAKIRGIRR